MTNAQPEPSMEEILASIRRIISEDEEEQPGVDRSSLDRPATESGTVSTLTPKPASTSANADTPRKDASNLAQMLDLADAKRSDKARPSVDEKQERAKQTPDPDEITANDVSAQTESNDDGDQASEELSTEDVKMVKQQAATALKETDDTSDAILDETTASAAAAAFGSLARSARVAEEDGKTLEAIVTEMLRPMVKDWLDTNLARIVEEKVEYEVQRLARR